MTPRKAFALAMVSMMDLFVVIKVTCCQRYLGKRRNIGNLRFVKCWMWTTETGTQKHRQAQKQKYKQKKETQTNTVCEKHKPLFLCLCHIPSMIGQYWKRVSLDMLDMAKENWKFKDDLCWLPVVASGTISTMCPDWLTLVFECSSDGIRVPVAERIVWAVFCIEIHRIAWACVKHIMCLCFIYE